MAEFNLVNRSALDNALQRISQLERMAVNTTSAPSATTSNAVSNHSQSINDAREVRPSSSYQSTQTATTSINRSSGNNTMEELYSRFPSLRRPNTRPQTGQRRRASSTPRSVPKGKKKHTTRPVLRDLVLIPNPEETTVPTHSTRVLLDSKGFVVHSFPFDREWDSRTLTHKIYEAFPNHVLLCFEYMKASYGKLIKPNLASGVEMTGNLLLKLSGQGSVYIRSLEYLDSLDDDNASALNQSPVIDHRNFPDDIFDDLPPFHDELSSENSRADDQHTTVANQNQNQNEAVACQNPSVANNQIIIPAVETTVHDPILITDDNPDPSRNDVLRPVSNNAVHANQLAGNQSSQPTQPVREILVHRSHVLKDIIEEFKDPNILGFILSIVIVNENGQLEAGQGAGVMREVISLFWQQFFPSLGTGANEKVPSVRHDYQLHEWEAIARFLVYGFCNVQYFPIPLSSAFIACCLFGEESITNDFLLEAFYNFLPSDEAEALKKSTYSIDFDPNDEDLLDILSSYKCFKNPTKENISLIVKQLAHQELIQKPRYISNCWYPIFQRLKELPQFSSLENLKQMYDSKKPTPKKVVKLFNGSPSTDSERQTFGYLKKFVKTLPENSLKSFLQFTTGSDLLVTPSIEVSFKDIDGAARTPVARTCGPVLEVPSTYQSFNELAEEFSNVLKEKESWSFSIV